VPDDPTPLLVLLGSTSAPLLWTGDYWLHPLPPPGNLVLGLPLARPAHRRDAGRARRRPAAGRRGDLGPIWQSS
jgi:hypothetical protein